MRLNSEKVIGFYGKSRRGVLNLFYIGEGIDTHSLGKMQINSDENADIFSLKLNAELEPDVRVDEFTEKTIINHIDRGIHYKSDNRIFLFSNGAFIDIKHLFIERVEPDFFDDSKFEFVVSCADLSGEVIQLFSIPTGSYTDESVKHFINFEVERLLQTEGITIIDEEDAITLFNLAVKYIEELYNQVVEFEEEYDL